MSRYAPNSGSVTKHKQGYSTIRIATAFKLDKENILIKTVTLRISEVYSYCQLLTVTVHSNVASVNACQIIHCRYVIVPLVHGDVAPVPSQLG